MPTVSTVNTRHPKQAPAPLRKPNGSAYRYELITHDGELRYYADHVDDLMPGVMDREAERISLGDRIQHARIVQAVSQNHLLKAATAAGIQVSDHARGVIAGAEPVGDAWEEPVTLVLLSTDFAPHTDQPVPFSLDGDVAEPRNIIWLRPETNESYVFSLASIGWIQLSRHVTHSP